MRETKHRARAVAALGIALLTLAPLPACSGAGGGSQDQQHTAAAPDKGATATAGADEFVPAEQPTLPPPSSVANDTEKRKQVTITACEATKDGWRAAGTALNPGGQDAKYRIAIHFTSHSATVLAVGETAVDVKPGQSGTWEVRQAFHAPQGTLCVLRGVG
ncbi:hypothetical protein [Kitasatospora sp. NPDC089509]|uniref:hypothetical protein n=1 Tax=Kitasatospora sp. NPDC089509 TaxID=3364079 RepID=UPI003805542F